MDKDHEKLPLKYEEGPPHLTLVIFLVSLVYINFLTFQGPYS